MVIAVDAGVESVDEDAPADGTGKGGVFSGAEELEDAFKRDFPARVMASVLIL